MGLKESPEGTRLERDLSAVSAEQERACFICNNSSCKLISHRLLMLESLRRAHRQNQKSSLGDASKRNQRLPDLLQIRPIAENIEFGPKISASVELHSSIIPFTDFPVKKASKTVLNHFHTFFTHHGRSITQGQHMLFFDSGHYHFLLPQALQNSALCLSLVAMSATYSSIHDRHVQSPDAALISIYNQAFSSLRKELYKTKKRNEVPHEATIMAIIDLSMACGIAFGDSKTAIAHWQGVLALVPANSRQYYSGAINGFLDQMIYWLSLIANLRPGFTHWPAIVQPVAIPTEVYGHAWRVLFQDLSEGFPTARIMELCSEVCRATEILESHAQKSPSSRSASSMTYFQYIRSVIQQKAAILFEQFDGTSTILECVVIAINIFYCLILRMTPWKAPITFLCLRLRQAMTQSRLSNGPTMALEVKTLNSSSSLLRIWLLFVYLHAARVCKDESLYEWGEAELRPALLQVAGSSSQSELRHTELCSAMQGLCWSNLFMNGNFVEICDELLQSDSSSLSPS